MSKINAVRLINLNYNNSTIRISDETFQLGGESTLLSLRNGGGKSVLVQMIMAPFVHKRYQNAKDRPFSSYFTTNKPTFILVEWKLDQGAGYVLTGMMVRKNQEISEDRQDELEMVNFIAEYKERCAQDIYHLPVVEKTKKDITLKGFGVCRQLFETWKKDRSIPFFYYDMNNSAQAKQYFEKLTEYQIYYKEWESIIKKVNLKESGLSDLFADCRDEKGLVEKWFLEAVENKLNQDKNRMKEFQGIMEKYTGQYKDNQSKIKRRDTIRAFGKEAEKVQESAFHYRDMWAKLERQKARIVDFICRLRGLEQREKAKAEVLRERIEGFMGELLHLEYEKLSGEFYDISHKEQLAVSNLEMLRIEEEDLERRKEEITHGLHLLACAKQQDEVEECREERDSARQRLLLCREKQENLEPERNRLGSELRKYYDGLQMQKGQERRECSAFIGEMEQKKEAGREKLEELRRTERELTEQAGALNARAGMFDRTEDEYNRTYQEEWHRNLLGEYEAGALQIAQAEYEKTLSVSERTRSELKKEIEQCKEQLKGMRRQLEDKAAEKSSQEAAAKEARSLLEGYEQELAERSVILRYLGMGQDVIYDTEKILAAVQRKLLDTDMVRQNLEKEADGLEKEYKRMAQGQVLELSEEFKGMLEEAGIHYVYGMEWLRKNQFSVTRNQQLAAKQPFLPYSLILSEQELERLSGLSEQVYTSSPVPILLREELERSMESQTGAVRSYDGLHFYVWFNDNLLDEEKLNQLLSEQSARIQKLQKSIETKKAEYAEYIGQQEKLRNQKVSQSAYEAAKEDIDRLGQVLAALEQELVNKREALETLEESQSRKEQQITALEKDILYQNRRLADFAGFVRSYGEYRENCRQLEKNQKERERILHLQKLEEGKINRLEQELVTERNRLSMLEREEEECVKKQARYQQYAVLGYAEEEKTHEGQSAAEVPGEGWAELERAHEGQSAAEIPGEGWAELERAHEGQSAGATPSEGWLSGDEPHERQLPKGASDDGRKGDGMPDGERTRTGEWFGNLLSAEQAKEAESRYDVITSGISSEQKELEERAEKAEKRYGRAVNELQELAEKYGMQPKEWSGVLYHKKEETHQEILLEDQERKIGRKKEQIEREKIQCALLGQEKKGKLAQMKERCQKEEPIAKEEIQTIDFQDAIKKLEYEREEAEKEEKQVQKKLQGYESNLTALAEYEAQFAEEGYAIEAKNPIEGRNAVGMGSAAETESAAPGQALEENYSIEYIRREPIVWDVDLAALTGAELTKQKGILLRDYNSYKDQHRDARSGLERVLNRMLRMEAFGEDFYQKPLEAMLQLTEDAGRVIRQLETTLASYHNLMEKLQVDISMVEKEKAKIVELVGDYLKEVHDNMNKIDRNSTITVRERPVKMLKIELPDWSENESLYTLRLQDYIDDVTAKGIALLEENQNMQEFLGTRITTKGLYDAVIGIGNVQIRLYKIEAQREYPITWADVAKNSGGEGFLSAFVILSALLYYMRKDDSDLFADRNEGKVLLMDNPFAQTNASHLLKPLMDMAKKANTQLICLTGLGGESIYNRFDNIYVLTLIAANLRNDMQYLRAEHMRGTEEETMIVSQIEVMEQQELVF